MKISNTLTNALLVFGLGALLTYFGLPLPQKQIEAVVDEVVIEVGKQVDAQKSAHATLQGLKQYEVSSVIDGDTFTIMKGGQEETVRVLGIDTPETKYSNRGAECFGTEASWYAKTLLQGMQVSIENDEAQGVRDKYNRILAYVTLPDGRDFGQVMIADGYAYEYTFKGRAYQKQSLYKEAQNIAQKEKVGLWEEGVCQ